ncbi:MAG: ABC transporter permease [Lachnospirales bacterium]
MIKNKMKKLKAQWPLQIMVWPCIILMIVFSFIPMLGLIIAFQDYSPYDGFLGSEFVALANFKSFLTDPFFFEALINTFGISTIKLFIGFPAEIILAIMIYELADSKFKKISQTISYLPHFLSWVILGGMLISWMGSSGLFNNILIGLGIIDTPILYLGNPDWYWWIAALSEIWKEIGWGTILYLAAMAGIDPTLYEAAEVDGAGKLKRIWHILLPGIRSIIILMFVLRVSGMIGANLDQALVLQNSANLTKSQVIDSYVYTMGMKNGDYSYATAVGIFSSIVSVTFLLVANFLTKKIDNETSIF